jgi:hypothetical protein
LSPELNDLAFLALSIALGLGSYGALQLIAPLSLQLREAWIARRTSEGMGGYAAGGTRSATCLICISMRRISRRRTTPRISEGWSPCCAGRHSLLGAGALHYTRELSWFRLDLGEPRWAVWAGPAGLLLIVLAEQVRKADVQSREGEAVKWGAFIAAIVLPVVQHWHLIRDLLE